MDIHIRRFLTIGLALVLLASVVTLHQASACHSNIHILDADTGHHITGCKAVKVEFKKHESDSYELVGYFKDGQGVYKGTGYYKFTYRPGVCSGYEFDHWKASGSVQVIRNSGGVLEYKLVGSVGHATLYLTREKVDLYVDIHPDGAGKVRASPKDVNGNNVVSGADGTLTYRLGEKVKLIPEAEDGWVFDHWEGDGSGSYKRTVKMCGDRSVKAVFKKIKHKLVVTHRPQNGGTTTPSGTHWYDHGEEVTVRAYPNTGWKFDHWELSGCGCGCCGCGGGGGGTQIIYTNPVTVTMDKDYCLEAVFVEKPARLEINIMDQDGSVISHLPSPVRLSTGTYYTSDVEDLDYGTTVSINQVPCQGSGCVSGDEKLVFDEAKLNNVKIASPEGYSFTVPEDDEYPTVLDFYFQRSYKLNLEIVDQDGSPITLPGCSVTLTVGGDSFSRSSGDWRWVEEGTGVTISTIPDVCSSADERYVFKKVYVDGVERSEGYSFTMDDAHTVRVVYQRQYKLDVEIEDRYGNPITLTGCSVSLSTGSYTSSDSEWLDEGTTVNVINVPDTCTSGSSRYVHFSTKLDGSSFSGASFQMNDHRIFEVRYKVEHKLTVKILREGGGSLTIQGDHVSIDVDPSSYSFTTTSTTTRWIEHNAEVTIAGVPDEWNDGSYDYELSRIVRVGTGQVSEGYSFTMTSDNEIDIYYSKMVELGVEAVNELDSTAPGLGVRLNPPNSVYSSATVKYEEGTSVTATPSGTTGFVFDHWILDGAADSSSTKTFTMDDDRELKAVFWHVRDIHFQVVDDRGAALGCSVTLTYEGMGSEPAFTPMKNPTSGGTFTNGQTKGGVYQYSKYSVTAGTCSGYRFDHWEITGTSEHSESGSSANFKVLAGDVTVKAVYAKQVTLTTYLVDEDDSALSGASILVSPPGNPFSNGDTHTYDRDTSITAGTSNTPAGYRFDHWELDGVFQGTGSTTTFTMGDDRELTAVYWEIHDVSFVVVDNHDNALGCQITAVVGSPTGARNTPRQAPTPHGDYGNGDGLTGIYKYSDVMLNAKACSGYRFDHWEITGGSSTTTSGESASFKVGDSDVMVKAVYVRQYRLDISVEPPGSGSTSPLAPGTYMLDEGTRVTLLPAANAGWAFSHWTLDGVDTGSVVSPALEVVMNSDHEVVAHFVEAQGPTPPIPVGSPAYRACELFPDGWPYSAKYRSLYVDLNFNEDLLKNLSGMASPIEKDNILVLGKLATNPQPWSKFDVRLTNTSLIIKTARYDAKWGERDYGLIYLNCHENFTTWVAGVTRYGTRAALMWLLNHPDEMKSHLLVAVEWVDANGNGHVEDQEIRVIYTLP